MSIMDSVPYDVLQNWRAAAAMTVSVPLLLPGLVHSIDTNKHVGVGIRLFDLAYLLGVSAPISPPIPVPFTVLQFTLASAVYFTLSRLFPAHETMIDHAILGPETLPDDGRSSSGSDEKKGDDRRVDETLVDNL
jgi:NCS1 family nucleobase:cation symporter-1